MISLSFSFSMIISPQQPCRYYRQFRAIKRFHQPRGRKRAVSRLLLQLATNT
jgi:hypothetical protein